MKNEVLISVIIPIYNVKNYIIKCIQSVVEQDINYPIETILVDDCGTDNSFELAKTYIETLHTKNRIFHFVRHSNNKGQAAARNTGVKVAAGKYIFFLDSDDTIDRNALSTLINYTKCSNADIIEAASKEVDEKGRELYRNCREGVKMVEGSDMWRIGSKWKPVCWNKLIYREVFINKNLWFYEGFYYEDLVWAYQVALSNVRILSIPELTYNYLVRGNSTVHSMSQTHVESFIIMVKTLADLYTQSAKKGKLRQLAYATYEYSRAVAIDMVYPKCTESQKKELFNSIKKYNVESFFFVLRFALTRSKFDFRMMSKILPLYMGSKGHNFIKLKSFFLKLFR